MKHIVVFGAANVDIAASSAVGLALGDSTPGHTTTTAGGVGRNIAENLARLGRSTRWGHSTHTDLFSAVGDDLQGEFLLRHTRHAGVDVSTCSVLPGQTTGTYVAMYNPGGSLLAAVNDMAVLDLLTSNELARHAAASADASAWVLDCNLSPAAIAWLMQTSAGVPIFVDGVSSQKCIKILPYLAQINTLKVNRLEAAALTGLTVGTAEEAITAAQNLCARGVTNVVVSLGSGGVCWSTQGSHGHQAAIEVKVVNANGAGDALTAGLVHGALAGWPLARSARFANACAAFTTTCSAANHPELSATRTLQLLDGN